MNEKLTSNNTKDVDFTSNNEKSDYEKLMTKLLEIRETMFLLEKLISR